MGYLKKGRLSWYLAKIEGMMKIIGKKSKKLRLKKDESSIESQVFQNQQEMKHIKLYNILKYHWFFPQIH